MIKPVPRISVVIPLYNGRKTILDLLNSLADQTLPPLEVIIVDNNSTDGSVSVIEGWKANHPDFPLVMTAEKTQGRCYARNRGIQIARGEFIALFDADCVCHKDWISNCTDALQISDASTIGGIVEGYRMETPTEKVLHFLHCPKAYKYHGFKEVNEWDIMRGSIESNNVVIDSAALRHVGGFDQDTFKITGEDFDLFLRLLKNGFKLIGHHKKLMVFHQHRTNIRDMLKQVFVYGYCFAECVSVHYRRRLVAIGRQHIISTPFPFTVWLRFSKAFIVVCGLFPIILIGSGKYFFIPVSAIFIAFLMSWRKKFKKSGMQITLTEFFQSIAIALLHKIALAAGHVWGSIRFRICCL